jgi:di/tricarboxylate transporter
MTLQALITFIVLIAALLVLATQRLRPDLTALLVMLTLVLTGILSPTEAFSAFGQPVIIIIPSIYVLGAALYETGVATIIADQILRFAPRNQRILAFVIMLVAGLLSAVITSLLVVAVLMPAVLRVARKARLAPAQLLLPLATAATMGNTLTLFGAISNVVINDVLVASGQEGLSFFSLTPYGLVSLGVVVLWYLVGGQRLLGQELPDEPERPSLQEVERTYQLDDQLYQLRVRSGSDLIGERIDSSKLRSSFRLNVVAIQPRDSGPQPARTDWVLERDDLLVVEGARGDVFQAASLHRLQPKGELPLQKFNEFEEESLRLAEVMVPFRSQWVGKTLTEIRFRERYGLNVLAVQRQGEAIRNGLPDLSLAIGDTLLVQGPVAQLRDVGQDRNLVLATYLGPPPGELVTSKARLTLVILV